MNDEIKKQPKGGRGFLKILAGAGGMTSPALSQILNGDRDLSQEHTWGISKFLKLNEEEADYFLLLVNYARAGKKELKQFYRNKINSIQKNSLQLKNTIEVDRLLDERVSLEFYSNWLYSAIRALYSIQVNLTSEQVAKRLGVSASEVESCVQYMVRNDLLERVSNGYKITANLLHLPADSPGIVNRHTTWRIKGFEKMRNTKGDDFYFTGPLTISESGVLEVSKKLRELVKEISVKITQEKPEAARCLNIDWFKF